jgi:hypothetical protein
LAQRQIPPERRAIFYVGLIVSVIGILSFLSTFLSFAAHFGDFTNFEQRGSSMMMRAVIGMVMMIAGGLLSGVGKAGLAGSGIILDTEQARRDVEPWSRRAGGVLKDAMDEAGIGGDSKPTDETLAFDERLRRLKQLRDDGLVSEQEYESTKKKILESA